MVGLSRKTVGELGKTGVAVASAELVVVVKLVEVGVVMMAGAVVSELGRHGVEHGAAVAEVVGVAVGGQIVVGKMVCCVGRDSDIVAAVFLPLAFAVSAAIVAAGLTRMDCNFAGSDMTVVDAGSDAVDAIVADIAAVGKDIAADVAVVAVDATVYFALSGSWDIAARTASGMALTVAEAVGMVALAAVFLYSDSSARVDRWMLE